MLLFKKYKSLINNNAVLSETISFLVQRTPLPNIIFVGNIDKHYLDNRSSGTEVFFIGNRSSIKGIDFKNIHVIEYNLEKGLPKLEVEFFNNSIVVLDNVLEGLSKSKNLLIDLQRYSNSIPSILISGHDDDYKNILKKYGLANGFWGNVPSELYSVKKENWVYIGGYLSNFKKIENPNFKICAIISTYNEEDIIEQVCKYLLDQNIHVHIIDNWSTDRTLSIVESFSKKDGRISFEIFPEKDAHQHVWFDMLNRKIDYSNNNAHDWFIHYDADEFRESCFKGISLREGIMFVDSLGFNAIDHTVVDFRPVEDGFDEGVDPNVFFKYFEFGNRPGHFAQIKAWKNFVGAQYDLSSNGGHVIEFEDKKVYPYKFLLKHYSLRSKDHMAKKIYKDRLPRFEKGRKEKGWHTHYDKYIDKKGDINLWAKDDLYEFNKEFYSKYLLERLFGINIEKKN